MPRIRYTDGPDEVIVAPAGRPQFTATRGEWVDVADDDVVTSLCKQGWEAETTKARGAKTEKE